MVLARVASGRVEEQDVLVADLARLLVEDLGAAEARGRHVDVAADDWVFEYRLWKRVFHHRAVNGGVAKLENAAPDGCVVDV